MFKKVLLASFFYCLSSFASGQKLIIDSLVYSPSKLGKVFVGHDQNGFKIFHNGLSYEVKNYNVDPILRNVTHEQLKKFLNHGYITVNQFDNKEFTLRGHVRGVGGGPASAWAAYNITRALCYGIAVAGAGAAIVSTGGLAGAASGALVGVGTLGASSSAGVAALAISGAGLTTEAAMITAASVTATGGTATGAVAAIEGASAVVGTFFACLPFLP